MKKPNSNDSIILLMHDVNHLIRKYIDEQAQIEGLTQTQCRALVYISRFEGCTQKALSDRLDIRPISLSKLVDRLEKADLVERRADPNDRRATCLYLTSEAYSVLAQIKKSALVVTEKALEGATKESVEFFLNMLQNIKINLNKE